MDKMSNDFFLLYSEVTFLHYTVTMNLFMGVDSSNPYNIFAKVILKKYESKNLKKKSLFGQAMDKSVS